MPIFTGLDPRPPQPLMGSTDPALKDMSPSRLDHRSSEESIRTEFCEGPVPDELVDACEIGESGMRHDPMTIDSPAPVTSNRAELIERLKRGESPQWVSRTQVSSLRDTQDDQASQADSHHHRPELSLLPAIELKGPLQSEQAAAMIDDSHAAKLGIGLNIQRPRSALHSGNFSENANANTVNARLDHAPTLVQNWSGSGAYSPPRPVYASGRRSSRTSSSSYLQTSPNNGAITVSTGFVSHNKRPRAPSFSFRSPTSPLAQQSSQDSGDDDLPLHKSSVKDFRRRTMPAELLQSLRSTPSGLAQAARQPSASSQYDNISFSAHSRDVRRSVTFSSPFLASGSPPTPNFLRSRRSSYSSEAPSPLQPSSMVGSYEESILRGRMSSMPSRPFDFTAQIGALGKDGFKPKHPSHVSLTFPAVFYNWNSIDMPGSAEPSPYVGRIDLKHGLPPPPAKRHCSRRDSDAMEIDQGTSPEMMQQRWQTRSESVKREQVGGCYRIAQRGQLQIMIKNPNKTAVKLFLIPYELDDMVAGSKTFVRQNCYSTDEKFEISLPKASETDSHRRNRGAQQRNKESLRYSIHLHICCPSKGKFYLYKEIKVVFANRVPDNKEKLRCEIRLPEPRYSPWRPAAETPSSPTATEAPRGFENRHRRRSSHASVGGESNPFGVHFEKSLRSRQAMSPVPPEPAPSPKGQPEAEASVPVALGADVRNMTAMPSMCEHSTGQSRLQSPSGYMSPNATANFSDSLRSRSSNDSAGSSYSKLSKGDIGYGGLFARPGTPDAGESLLSRKLRSLDGDCSKQP